MEGFKIAIDFVHDHAELFEAIFTILFFVGTGIFIYFFRPEFFQKIKSGFRSFSTAFSFANKHAIIWFAATAKAILALSFLALLIILEKYNVVALSEESRAEMTMSGIAILIGIALLMRYSSRFMDIAMVHYTLGALEARRITLSESISKSFKSAWLLFKFVLLDMLIAVLTKKDGSKRSSGIGFVNNILGLLAGLAWSAATYFIEPVIAEEGLSLRQSIRRSAETMKNSFGQVAGFEVGVAVYVALPVLVTSALGMGFLFLAYAVSESHALLAKACVITALVSFALLFLCMIVAFIIQQATTWIFTCAAYNYTRGRSTGPLDAHFITAAIIKESDKK